MFELNFFIAFVVAVSGAPSPYYSRSLVETPTSRVEQHLLLSPQQQQSYRVQPPHVMSFSDFDFPKEQVIYYYPQQPHHEQQPLNLYELRQDMPWWQGLWNQLTGEGLEGGEEEQEGSVEDLFGEDAKTTTKIDFPTTTTTNAPELNIDESNKIAPKDDAESIVVQAAPQPEKLRTQPTRTVEVIQGSQQIQAPLHQLFLHNNRYYIASGSPEFYGNFDAFRNPTAPIFSLQQLQPIVRSEDDNIEEKVQKIAQLPMPSSTESLRINVVDEDEAVKNEKDSVESEQVIARSQLPSDNQSSEESAEKMSREEEKQEQSASEGQSRIFHDTVINEPV